MFIRMAPWHTRYDTAYLGEHPGQFRSRYLRQTQWHRRRRLFRNNLSVWGEYFRQPPSIPVDRPDWHRGIGSLRLWNTMGKKQIVWLKSWRKKLLLFLFVCKSHSDSLLLTHTHTHTRTHSLPLSLFILHTQAFQLSFSLTLSHTLHLSLSFTHTHLSTQLFYKPTHFSSKCFKEWKGRQRLRECSYFK